MLLAIDIGNTTIDLAIMRGQQIVKIYTIETNLAQRVFKSKLHKQLLVVRRRYPKVDTVVICSVVPKKLKLVKASVEKTLRQRAYIVGQHLKVPIKNCYRNPRQVGQDRLVCAYAALRLYGLPSIVIDYGTAITFDVVSRKREYLGGIIVPGIRLSAESLFKKTALLPKIKIKAPRSLIGRDTQGSILSGLFHGYGALSKGLIESISKEIKGRPKVVVTGGYTKLVQKFTQKRIDVIDQHLVFKGMNLLYHSTKK